MCFGTASVSVREPAELLSSVEEGERGEAGAGGGGGEGIGGGTGV